MAQALWGASAHHVIQWSLLGTNELTCHLQPLKTLETPSLTAHGALHINHPKYPQQFKTILIAFLIFPVRGASDCVLLLLSNSCIGIFNQCRGQPPQRSTVLAQAVVSIGLTFTVRLQWHFLSSERLNRYSGEATLSRSLYKFSSTIWSTFFSNLRTY